jgi:hypothetical protein
LNQLKMLLPQFKHRVILKKLEISVELFHNEYIRATWDDRVEINDAFLGKMKRRFDKHPSRNLYLFTDTDWLDEFPKPSRYRALIRKSWCLFFLTENEMQRKLDKLLVASIHDE